MNAGSTLAKGAGDFVLMKDDLNAISYAFKLSQKSFAIIKQNLFWAFFYNLCCIPVAAGLPSLLASWDAFTSLLASFLGIERASAWALYLSNFVLTPHLAALAMCFSSIAVVLNSLRLRKDLR